MTLELDHVVLEVADPATSANWYQTVLRLKPMRLAEFLAGAAPFPSGRVDGGTILDYFPPRLWANQSRAANPNHLCFNMTAEALNSLEQRLDRLKLPILNRSERNFGARGWGRSFYFADPDGISLEARTYEGVPQ